MRRIVLNQPSPEKSGRFTYRTEFVALNVENIRFEPDGSSTITFDRQKNGEISTNYMRPPLLEVLRAWTTVARIATGALFLHLDFSSGNESASA